jgi:hypothetical protein
MVTMRLFVFNTLVVAQCLTTALTLSPAPVDGQGDLHIPSQSIIALSHRRLCEGSAEWESTGRLRQAQQVHPWLAWLFGNMKRPQRDSGILKPVSGKVSAWSSSDGSSK